MQDAKLFVVALWLVFAIVWLALATRTKKTIPMPSGFRRQVVPRLVMIVALVIVLEQPELRHFFLLGSLVPPGLPAQIGGFVICLSGFGFAFWARLTLGANWGIPMSVRENPDLVTAGPYRWVRHPIYTGVLVATIGSFIASGNIWLASLAFSAPFFIYSGFAEERLMTETFPNQYPEYKKHSKMLVPFVF